ncbi:hypothetical protein C8C93_1999 [Acidovorax sp. 93]|nr:hypothetical protein C8C93_1999 [Acidovorax sp. 93]
MVMAWPSLQDAAPNTSMFRLPMACPLEEPPDAHHTLWTALWQAACLLRPEVSPAQWRPRVRRLARVANALIHEGDTDVDAPGAHEAAQATMRTQLDERITEWVRRLLQSSRKPTAGHFRSEISFLESAELDLDAMEACRKEGGITLLAWRRRRDSVFKPKSELSGTNRLPEPDHWQWRVVAGLEGLEGPGNRGGSAKPGGRFEPRSVLLLPQELEAVWGCGYGMRLGPAASLESASPVSSGHRQLRSLYGSWTAVEVVRVLMLRLNPW